MKNSIILKVGENHTLGQVVSSMVGLGYERVESLEHPGQFVLNGGNLIVFGALEKMPRKIEFFGDEIDRITKYDILSGRNIETLDLIDIRPNLYALPDGSKLRPGDFVVHEDHGIGRFSHSLVRIVNNKEESYFVVEYLNNDVLYVPMELSEKISLYVGIGRKRPKLNKLGTPTWQKTYKKTYENIIKMAKELLLIYAKREIVKRKPYIISEEWNRELLKTFDYRETPDQERAIFDVYSDLHKHFPMDRLICGDVGFGKTEVALRAAMQTCFNGFQVAILVPTTILAEQHFQTIKKRFAGLPITVSELSRFVSGLEQKEIIDQLENGSVDVVVGTHKLFNEKIKFKNLGLLIIDEEQKFGVKDKERLKKIRTNVNVISLTATPIPRTLFMALSGIRDLSQISTPPIGRKEIETEVLKYDELIIKKRIEDEIRRGGQVYYLHNEVSTIGAKRRNIQKMFPNLRIEVAHGQQSERVLASMMSEFTQGKIDILVCSTIIENGLDLPNVNTLIVEEADKFGLAQLYQIRGRIGRSERQAFAIFTYKDKKLTDNAFKRFKALVENTDLGSGYNIALSDLEIRGGGNVLGREQHGNMEAIGLVLYSKLLNQAVLNLRNKIELTGDKSATLYADELNLKDI